MRATNEQTAYPLGPIQHGLGVAGIHQWPPPNTVEQGVAVMNQQRVAVPHRVSIKLSIDYDPCNESGSMTASASVVFGKGLVLDEAVRGCGP